MLPVLRLATCISHKVPSQDTACIRGFNVWRCTLSRGDWLFGMCAVVMLKLLFLTLT